MPITIDYIAKNPQSFTYDITHTETGKFTLRALEHDDENQLLNFFKSLSGKTKRFYSYADPLEEIAKEMCDAINKYDKVRFILEKEENIIGLFEFSMDILANDVERFKKYDIRLSSQTDCRLAPLLSDSYQSQGLGTIVLPFLIKIAKDFGRNRIILWGGVLQDNLQAIHFYEKNDFKKLGEFNNNDNLPSYDMIMELKKYVPTKLSFVDSGFST